MDPPGSYMEGRVGSIESQELSSSPFSMPQILKAFKDRITEMSPSFL